MEKISKVIRTREEETNRLHRIAKGAHRHISDVIWFAETRVGRYPGHRRDLRAIFNKVAASAQRSGVNNQVDRSFADRVIHMKDPIKQGQYVFGGNPIDRSQTYHVVETIGKARDGGETSEMVQYKEKNRIASKFRRKGWREIFAETSTSSSESVKD